MVLKMRLYSLKIKKLENGNTNPLVSDNKFLLFLVIDSFDGNILFIENNCLQEYSGIDNYVKKHIWIFF